MHLVKSHRLQDGIVNPTIRKDLKSTPKFYCCPIEGCPRGPNRPFSQFSLVKQHFMKMHAEKKHKCTKCSNSYGTEWDLKRHAEDCGKTFQCTCGCPYASRTALLSHVYRTGHELPAEHRDPPSKKRKMESSGPPPPASAKATDSAPVSTGSPPPDPQGPEPSEVKQEAPFEGPCGPHVKKRGLTPARGAPKPLLPRPRVALLKVPIVQFSHLPILVPAADPSGQPLLVGLENQGPVVNAVRLLPLPVGTVLAELDAEAFPLEDGPSAPRAASAVAGKPVGPEARADLRDPSPGALPGPGGACRERKISPADVQMAVSCSSEPFAPPPPWGPPDSSVSSCSQTDLTFGSQVSLPISVQTQTFLPHPKVTSSIAAQTDAFAQACLQACGVSRETQTNPTGAAEAPPDDRRLLDQAVMGGDLFESVHSPYGVSAPGDGTIPLDAGAGAHGLLSPNGCKTLSQELVKSAPILSFGAQGNLLPPQTMTDNQTQTMDLLNDLENILTGNLSGQALDNRSILSGAGPDCGQLAPGPPQNPAIDFDIEEFFSASNIQTQTEESELGGMHPEPVLESLDIETQTDFLLADGIPPPFGCRGSSGFLGLEMFDTQTQTDLNFFLDSGGPLPLDSLLKQSSFSVSTDSSDTETQTEGPNPARGGPRPPPESKVQLNSAETQTVGGGLETLGSLFLTSNETQTAMDDFLLDTMESQFSSVETQTCAELRSVPRF
ncbi:ATM interactor [Tachyglossus aculeatus]|uniref:ATM interactor n=1 Tax=Tachyglossus aculeatus TaxID=9261 RepID=UPI0018F4AB13|nr:ATM interactor [Tachyglossus aculeatus]